MSAEPSGANLAVGVVIVTYNSADHVADLARTLRASLEGVTHRVVAVDNDSADDTVGQLEAAGIEVVQMGFNAGYSAGLNAGMRRVADAGSVLVLNPDIQLDAASVMAMLAALGDPGVGIVVPQTRDYDGALARSQRRDPSLVRAVAAALLGGNRAQRWWSLSEVVADEAAYLQSCDVDWGVGAIMLISRACAEQVGEWDESFFLYSEEIDYCQRARRAGFAVRYEPSAVALHEGGGGVHQPRLRSMMVVNKVRLYRRQHAMLPSLAFFLAELLNESTRALLGNRAARSAALALLLPSRRPQEIKCSDTFLPR